MLAPVRPLGGTGQNNRLSLSPAGLDREAREVQHSKVDSEEGMLARQQHLRGALRMPEAGKEAELAGASMTSWT